MHLTILRFVIYYFLQLNVKLLIVFHCWDVETYTNFRRMAAPNYWFIQYLHANNAAALKDFEYRYLRHMKPEVGVFLDMSCEQADHILRRVSDCRFFSDHYRWLIYDDQANISNFRWLFTDYSLAVDAELTYAAPSEMYEFNETTDFWNLNSSYLHFTLYDVYNNGRPLGGKLNITIDREISCSILKCQVQRYLSTLHLRHKYEQRNRLHDITLRLSVPVTAVPVTSSDEVIINSLTEYDNRVDGISRYGFQAFLILKDFLGCNTTYVWRDRWSTNETYGGIIGDLAHENVDLVASPFLLTKARLAYFTVMSETSSFRSVCIFRTPRNNGIRGNVFLEPFSATVWLLFGVLIVIAALVLWSAFMFECGSVRRRSQLPYVPSFLSTFLIAFGSACIQGSSLVPSTLGGRVTFYLLYLLTFIMYNYYTSIVVSTLLGAPMKSDIKTMGELADSALEVGLDPLPFTFVYLNASQLPDIRRFVKRKIESKSNPYSVWMPVEQGILRVRDEPGFVFVLEAATGYQYVKRHYAPHEICDLNEIMLRPDRSLYTQVHKNSSYKQIIKQREIRMLETGVYMRMYRFWVQTHLTCFASNIVVEVGMQYMAPLFIMLLCGYALVLITLMLEIAYKRYVSHVKMQRELAAQAAN